MKKLVVFAMMLATVSYSCIQTPEPNVPKRINLLYNVENVGDTLVVSQDSIVVSEIKLLAEKLNLVLSDNTTLQTTLDAIVMAYRNLFAGQDEVIVSTNIGFEEFDQFKGTKFFISPPADDANIQDNDFFGPENNFSFIFRGNYNGRDFTYQSDTNFEKDFTFDSNVQLDNENETLVIRLRYDIRNILIDASENSIINPEDNANKSKIDSLLQQSLSVEAFAINAF